jgi:cell division inhibitor SepF
MAGLMRKTAVYLGLVDDEEQRYDDEYDEVDEQRRRYPPGQPARDDAHARPETGRETRRFEEGRVTGINAAAPRRGATAVVAPDNAADPYRITTLHPRTYNEARTIGEHFRDGTPVIMNLSDMDDADAKRLVDFSAGLIFGLRGSIERVTAKVFLLTPANIEVTAEDKARIAEGGFFNQS